MYFINNGDGTGGISGVVAGGPAGSAGASPGGGGGTSDPCFAAGDIDEILND